MSAMAVGYDPLKDKSYQHTRLGRPIVDHLAWKRTIGRLGRTLDDKERYLASFALMHPTLDITEVGPMECIHWIAKQPGGETRRVRRSHLNDFFAWAEARDLIEKHPMRGLEQQQRGRTKTYDTFSEGEVNALISLPATDGTLMMVLFDAGIRKSEALTLQPRHVLPEPTPGQLRIVGGKGNKDRVIPLTERLARALAELRLVDGIGETDYFWYSRPGGHHMRRSVRAGGTSFHEWWVRCVKQADVRYRNAHMARHTFATRWLQRGGRMETLSIVMGHSSIKTTEMYGHLDNNDVRRDLMLVEGFVQ